MCEKKNETTNSIRALVLVSLATVFKDIIPAYVWCCIVLYSMIAYSTLSRYRIRAPSEAERAVMVSKDVKKRQAYEGSLLSNYQEYLTMLHKLLDGKWMAI